MALYVHLVKMTREGATKIRDLVFEYAKVRSFTESLGGKPVCVVGCFGEYDFVSITDYPNEAAALKAVGMGLLDAHVRHCVTESIERGDGDEKVEELMSAVSRFSGR